MFFYDLNNSLGLMQADRQTDVDIDQHLAGLALQAQTKTQAQENKQDCFLSRYATSPLLSISSFLALSQTLVCNESF